MKERTGRMGPGDQHASMLKVAQKMSSAATVVDQKILKTSLIEDLQLRNIEKSSKNGLKLVGREHAVMRTGQHQALRIIGAL